MAVQLDTGILLTPEQEQQKWLTEAVHAATTKAASMNTAIAERNTLAVLSHASQMLAELRTGMLTPQYYYELYMRVFNEITPLQQYFLEEVRSGRQTPEALYATVQHAGNIVPRLMLLITIGSVYIQCKAAPAKDILGDLIEMVKGVQHPTRGLFVRHYLATLMKDKLPDVENEYEGVGGTVIDSATFILRNFKEMVWLWYRMETKSNIANKAKRDKERRDLRLLIGLNLRRLSDLQGLDKAMYVERILPVVLQIILEHQEPILQQYLTEVVVQVFPDEFHLATLRGLLDAASGLVTGVNVQSILCPLMDRLGKYVVALRDGTNDAPASKKEEKTIAKMFGLFKEKLGEIVQSHNSQSFPPVAFAETASALIKLTLRAYPDMVERVDEVLEVVYGYFSQAGIDDAASKTLRKMLEFVVEDIKQVNTVLDFQWYSKVIGLLGFQARRQVAMSLIDTAARLGAKIDTAERVGKLFDVISPLVKDVDDTPARKEDIYTISVADEFVEEQHVVCKALHLVDNEDAKDLSKLYSAIRRELGKGGTERLRYTMKAMASLYIRLALRCKKAEVSGGTAGANPEKLFSYIYTGDGGGILEHLATQAPIEGFYLYLHAANVADTCELHNNDTVGSLYGEAFKLYEESAGSTKQQLQMLNSLIGSLAALRSMPEDRYDVLATRLCQYSSRLVQKPDQSRMVMQCSHLFWKKALTEDLHRKTSECLTRSLKIADNCPSGLQFGLFAEALNHYSYYFNAQMPQVNATSLNAVISMNNDAITSAEDKNTEVFRAARRFFKNTASALKKRKDADETWAEIEI